MPDSNSSTTRELLIRDAFSSIGMDDPSTDEKAKGARKLNDIMAEIDPAGKWLWKISPTETSLSLVAGTRSYAVGTPPAGIPTYIQDLVTCVISRGTQRIPLRIIPHSELLESFELETSSGEPYMVALEVTADPADQKLHFLPTPATSDTVKFSYQQMLYDLDAASDAPDVKRSMRLSLEKMLKAELAPHYGVPFMEQQAFKAEAKEAKKNILAFNSQKVSPTRTQGEYY